jgi:hypothetical protein
VKVVVFKKIGTAQHAAETGTLLFGQVDDRRLACRLAEKRHPVKYSVEEAPEERRFACLDGSAQLGDDHRGDDPTGVPVHLFGSHLPDLGGGMPGEDRCRLSLYRVPARRRGTYMR